MSAAPTAPDVSEAQAALLRRLADRAGQDPVAGLLLAHLQAAEADAGPDPVDELQHRFEAALRANEKLRAALLAANEMTAWVARLVGACPRCWGLVADCPSCAGRGGPGHERPDVADLVAWLAPALRRSGLAVVRQHEGRAATAPVPTNPNGTTTTTGTTTNEQETT